MSFALALVGLLVAFLLLAEASPTVISNEANYGALSIVGPTQVTLTHSSFTSIALSNARRGEFTSLYMEQVSITGSAGFDCQCPDSQRNEAGALRDFELTLRNVTVGSDSTLPSRSMIFLCTFAKSKILLQQVSVWTTSLGVLFGVPLYENTKAILEDVTVIGRPNSGPMLIGFHELGQGTELNMTRLLVRVEGSNRGGWINQGLYLSVDSDDAVATLTDSTVEMYNVNDGRSAFLNSQSGRGCVRAHRSTFVASCCAKGADPEACNCNDGTTVNALQIGPRNIEISDSSFYALAAKRASSIQYLRLSEPVGKLVIRNSQLTSRYPVSPRSASQTDCSAIELQSVPRCLVVIFNNSMDVPMTYGAAVRISEKLESSTLAVLRNTVVERLPPTSFSASRFDGQLTIVDSIATVRDSTFVYACNQFGNAASGEVTVMTTPSQVGSRATYSDLRQCAYPANSTNALETDVLDSLCSTSTFPNSYLQQVRDLPAVPLPPTAAPPPPTPWPPVVPTLVPPPATPNSTSEEASDDSTTVLIAVVAAGIIVVILVIAGSTLVVVVVLVTRNTNKTTNNTTNDGGGTLVVPHHHNDDPQRDALEMAAQERTPPSPSDRDVVVVGRPIVEEQFYPPPNSGESATHYEFNSSSA